MVDDEGLMTTEQAAAHLGKSPEAARKWLQRRDIEPVGRQTGPKGQYLYLRTKVLDAEPGRRSFTLAYKMKILQEYEQLGPAERGALLRREGLYHAHVNSWRQARDRGRHRR